MQTLKNLGQGMRNHKSPASFTFLGLTDDPQLRILIFIFLLITYILSVAGNLIIIIFILVNSHLQTAMYFFLQNVSFLEISFTSTCIPRFLYSISTGKKIITYNACACQPFFTYVFAGTEFFLWVSMSYDRYVDCITWPSGTTGSAKCLSFAVGRPLCRS